MMALMGQIGAPLCGGMQPIKTSIPFASRCCAAPLAAAAESEDQCHSGVPKACPCQVCRVGCPGSPLAVGAAQAVRPEATGQSRVQERL